MRSRTCGTGSVPWCVQIVRRESANPPILPNPPLTDACHKPRKDGTGWASTLKTMTKTGICSKPVPKEDRGNDSGKHDAGKGDDDKQGDKRDDDEK